MSLVIGLMLQFSITHKEVHHDLSMDHEAAVSVGAVEREDVVGVIRIGEAVEEDEVDETDTMGTETEIGTEMIVDHQEVLVVIEIGTAIVVDVGSCNLACRCIIIDSMLEYAMSVLLRFVCRSPNPHFSRLVSLRL